MIGIKAKIRENRYLKYLLLVTNFFNSGFRGTDISERLFKILRIIIVFNFMFGLLYVLTTLDILFILGISMLFSYSVNYYFHFNLGTILVFYLRKETLNKDQFFSFIEEISNNALKTPKGILAIAAYGSISRGKMHSRSDLDVTLLRKKGIVNAFYAILFMEKMRRKANKNKIPFDTAVADSIIFLKNKYRDDEPPVIIYDINNILKSNYNSVLSISDARMINNF